MANRQAEAPFVERQGPATVRHVVSSEAEEGKQLRRALAFKDQGRYEEAVQELRTLLEVEPGNAAARRHLGLVLNFQGHFEESIAELRRTVDMAPQYWDARCDLVLAYAMLGMMDEAVSELDCLGK